MSRELPDSHIADHAEQFLATAELLLRNIPQVAAPSALKCNAAFAVGSGAAGSLLGQVLNNPLLK